MLNPQRPLCHGLFISSVPLQSKACILLPICAPLGRMSRCEFIKLWSSQFITYLIFISIGRDAEDWRFSLPLLAPVTRSDNSMIEDFVWEDHSAECLAYIYEDLLPTLSCAMKAVKEEIMTFGEKCLLILCTRINHRLLIDPSFR